MAAPSLAVGRRRSLSAADADDLRDAAPSLLPGLVARLAGDGDDDDRSELSSFMTLPSPSPSPSVDVLTASNNNNDDAVADVKQQHEQAASVPAIRVDVDGAGVGRDDRGAGYDPNSAAVRSRAGGGRFLTIPQSGGHVTRNSNAGHAASMVLPPSPSADEISAAIGRRRTSSATHESGAAAGGKMIGGGPRGHLAVQGGVKGSQSQYQLGQFAKNKRNYSAFNLVHFTRGVGHHHDGGVSTPGLFPPPSPSPSKSPSLNALAAIFGVRRSPSTAALDDSRRSDAAWTQIDQAVCNLFSGGTLQPGQLHELHTKVSALNASSFGPLINDYYRERLVPKGMEILRRGIMRNHHEEEEEEEETGNGNSYYQLHRPSKRWPSTEEECKSMVESLAATWTNFYRKVLPYLEAILIDVKTQGLSIRDTTLVGFRNLVVLRLPLKETLIRLREPTWRVDEDDDDGAGDGSPNCSSDDCEGHAVELTADRSRPRTPPAAGKTSPWHQRISPNNVASLQQMLLVLQGVQDATYSSSATAEQLELEKLVVQMVTPYAGHRGLYTRLGQEYPEVAAASKSASGLINRRRQRRRLYLRMHSVTAPMASNLPTKSSSMGEGDRRYSRTPGWPSSLTQSMLPYQGSKTSWTSSGPPLLLS